MNIDLIAVAMGDVDEYDLIHKYGQNDDIDAATFECIWQAGATYTGFDATAAETVQVFSSDADDVDTTGAGARTVEIFGLDANYNQQSEIIAMDGVTPAVSTNSYLRLNRAIVRTAGATGSNEGIITIRQSTTTANVFATIAAGFNQTMVAAYTIPNARTGMLLEWFATLAGSTQADCQIRIVARPPNEVFQVKEEISLRAAGSSSIQRRYIAPKGRYVEGTDIQIIANSDAANAAVSAGFNLLLTPKINFS